MMKHGIVAGAALLLSVLTPTAWAQGTQAVQKPQPSWKPTETVEFVGSASSGSGSDVLGRMFISIIEQNKLADVRFQMINKPGGGTTTAINYMVENTGDAHTVALFSNSWMTDHMTMQESTHGLLDLTPIAVLIEDPAVIVVRGDSPYKTVEDFIEAATANPGKLNQSGGSPMSRDNIVRNLIMGKTGAAWNFVSFPSGSERIAALLGGHVDVYIVEPGEAGEMIRSGRLRAVAQIAAKRLPSFPDIPTLQEIYDVPHVPLVRGIAGPPEMPEEAVAYYEGLFRKLVETKEWKAYSEQNQTVSLFSGSAEARAFLEKERNKIREAVTAAGIKVVR